MSEANATTAPAAGTTPAAEPVPVVPAPAIPAKPDGASLPPSGNEPSKQPDPEFERRAAALARAKRESARALQERQKAAQERAANADAFKKAAEYDRLQKIREEQGDYGLSKELKIDWGKGTRQYIDETTGVGKNPAEIAREEARRVVAEDKAKAEETAAKRAIEEDTQRQRQAYAGARQRIAELIASDPVKYELCNQDSDVAMYRAWQYVEKFWAKHNQVLDFTKAIDAAEADFEKMAKTNKGRAAIEREKAAALEAAKAQPKAKSAGVKSVETEEAPKSPPTLTKRPRPMDMLKLARQMGIAHKAAQDN